MTTTYATLWDYYTAHQKQFPGWTISEQLEKTPTAFSITRSVMVRGTGPGVLSYHHEILHAVLGF